MKSIASLSAPFLLLALTVLLPAQEPATLQPAPARRPLLGSSRASEADLSHNYRVTLSLKIGDHPAQVVEQLTASSQIKVSSVLGTDAATQGNVSARLSGILSELEDGRLRFSYQLGTSIPVVTQTSTLSNPTAEGGRSEVRSIQYVDESATGVVIMTADKPYELFKGATRSYSVTISPESIAPKR